MIAVYLNLINLTFCISKKNINFKLTNQFSNSNKEVENTFYL